MIGFEIIVSLMLGFIVGALLTHVWWVFCPWGDNPLSSAAEQPLHVEPFVVKHYSSDEGPTIKGNGFDGLQVGEYREESEEFIRWVNIMTGATPGEK